MQASQRHQKNLLAPEGLTYRVHGVELIDSEYKKRAHSPGQLCIEDKQFDCCDFGAALVAIVVLLWSTKDNAPTDWLVQTTFAPQFD
jgi:hypothetical protein